MQADVPSPVDLRRLDDARAWADEVMVKRPWRVEFFELFASVIQEAAAGRPMRVLELGSGPCFLAEHLLKALPSIEYVALDFSPAMHELAAQRLGPLAQRVKFVERSFLEESWGHGLGEFEVVVTLQAVHELRHKSRAPRLHAQVKELLSSGGRYLVCDHFSGEGGMSNDQLYMSVAEQHEALKLGGFQYVRQLHAKGSLVLHHAT
jgi:SAM-dependent methyltransferase